MRTDTPEMQGIQVRMDPGDDVFEAELLTRSHDDGRLIFLIVQTTSGHGKLSISIRSKEQLHSLRDAILEACDSVDLAFMAER